jgi:hypothetical protein
MTARSSDSLNPRMRAKAYRSARLVRGKFIWRGRIRVEAASQRRSRGRQNRQHWRICSLGHDWPGRRQPLLASQISGRPLTDVAVSCLIGRREER